MQLQYCVYFFCLQFACCVYYVVCYIYCVVQAAVAYVLISISCYTRIQFALTVPRVHNLCKIFISLRFTAHVLECGSNRERRPLHTHINICER